MRRLAETVAVVVTFACAPAAWAGDTVLFGPPPEWVSPAPALTPAQLSGGGVTFPLFDTQVFVDGDTATTYSDGAIAVSSPEVLSQVGTLSFSWQPAHGDLRVHSVQILRDGQAIDVLGDGSAFSVLRREARLEQKVLDGTLTAVMQVPGLRVGDVLRVVHSISEQDKTLGGAAQTALTVVPLPTTMRFGRARLVWPEGQKLAWKALMPGITGEPKTIAGHRKELVIALPVAKLPELPEGIPARFRAIPLIEASSFASWADVARVMEPLFRTEGTIAEGSDLAKVTDAIAARTADPATRVAEALRVVQGDVRYQLIALGSGNYVPQAPADTWQKRYGDCKAKTLLLLAMLHRMGITAEAVLANSQLGDMVPARLPAAMAFDHVFVRAELGGDSLWLDGTSLGARLADIHDAPPFGWVLPLRAKGAELLALPRRANARPAIAIALAYDASASIHLPMPYTVRVRLTGPQAEQLRTASAANDETLVNFAESNARSLTGSAIIGHPRARYDADDGSWTLEYEGAGGPDFSWQDGKWHDRLDPVLKIDFDPDRSKASWRSLPALVGRPGTARLDWSIRLPEGARGYTLENSDPVRVSLPAFAYERTVTSDGLLLTDSEVSRETGAEVPPAEIGATRKAASEIAAKGIDLVLPPSYPQRWEEIDGALKSPTLAQVRAIFDQRIADKPDDAGRLSDRAWLATRLFDWTAADADYSRALALDPTIERYLARGRVRSERGDFAAALKDARSAHDLDTDNEEASAFLADVLSELGKVDEALALLDPDPDLTNEDGEGKLATRAEILSRGGRTEEMIGLLDGALKKRASSAALLNARCWFKALAGTDLDAALTDCTRAIEIASNPAAYYDSRAMVHFRAGRMDQALTDLNAALAIAPELAPTRYMRGIIAARSGDRHAAAADIAAARRLSPSVDHFFARYGIKP